MEWMDDEAVMRELKLDSNLNRARKAFSGACGRIEQAIQQAQLPSPVEIRRMEFEAVREIAATFGVNL